MWLMAQSIIAMYIIHIQQVQLILLRLQVLLCMVVELVVIRRGHILPIPIRRFRLWGYAMAQPPENHLLEAYQVLMHKPVRSLIA